MFRPTGNKGKQPSIAISRLHSNLCATTMIHRNVCPDFDYRSTTVADWILDPCLFNSHRKELSNYYIHRLTGCLWPDCTVDHLRQAMYKIQSFSVIIVSDSVDDYEFILYV